MASRRRIINALGDAVLFLSRNIECMNGAFQNLVAECIKKKEYSARKIQQE